jgi:hypothetical protein
MKKHILVFAAFLIVSFNIKAQMSHEETAVPLTMHENSDSVDSVLIDDHHHGGHQQHHGEYHHGNQNGWHSWGHRPGYHRDWRYHAARPRWWGQPGIVITPWFSLNLPSGIWQCTAVNQYGGSATFASRDRAEAEYGALFDCGGEHFEENGCYIPDDYCRLR